MTWERRFIEWPRPLLPAAAEYLAARYATAESIELGGVVVALPGAAAGRRLLEWLVEQAQRDQRLLVPPRIVTLGELPELLYDARRPFADPLTQQLAWIDALQSLDPARLAALLPHPPEMVDRFGWLAIAERLAALHTELAADGLDIHGVLEHGKRLETFTEFERWQTLDAVRSNYLRRLDTLGLWDKQTARLFAVAHRECRTSSDLILVGTVDMNRTLRQMLDQVAPRVTAVISSPAGGAERFDAHGCLRPAAWVDTPIPLDDAQIEIVDGPAEQADGLLRALSRLNPQTATDDVTVGLPDETLAPWLMQRLGEAGLAGRLGAGKPIERSEPFQVLEAAADYLVDAGAESLARLVRLPIVERWLRRSIHGDYLTPLDQLRCERLPTVLSSRTLLRDDPPVLRQLIARIEMWLDAWRLGEQPVGQWARRAGDLLLEVCGESIVLDDAGREQLAAIEACSAAIERLAGLPDPLAPRVQGGEALRWLLRQLAGTRIPPPLDPAAIELRGWLELPLDDAPHVIVCGFNEGIVPAARNGDMFLPNELRRRLGLEDNAQRYARDAYALSLLIATRKSLHVIAGRRTHDGSPQVPSRLLFAAPDETMARRASSYFAAPTRRAAWLWADSPRAGRESPRFDPPRPTPLPEPVVSMRVTEFRDYLACPYRYYLRHRLNLSELSDEAHELDAGMFGSLLHNVLAAFGKHERAVERNADVLRDFFDALLEQEARPWFVSPPAPAVSIQLAQARRRLHAFADWQANWRREGAEIRHVEIDAQDRAVLQVDGQSLMLRGRIDRIDYHPEHDCWYVFDYKTAGRTPEQVHRKQGEWVDLQLPLYRHLVAALGIEGPLSLGYLLLPERSEVARHEVADWSADELAEADEVARRVIRAVWQEQFWPPADEPPAFSEEFDPICGRSTFIPRGLRDDLGELESP